MGKPQKERKEGMGKKGGNKAQKKPDRAQLEKQGDNSAASLKGALI